jgi:hypothetical protein
MDGVDSRESLAAVRLVGECGQLGVVEMDGEKWVNSACN